jgi:hypothetical protein
VRVRLTWRSAVAAALLLLAAAAPADAQGKGRGLGKNKKNAPAPGQGGGEAGEPGAPLPPGSGVRHFGAWLDDATLLPKGRGWATLSVGYYRSTFGHQVDAPSLDFGVALNRRVQVGVTVPYSRLSYGDGPALRGLGDTYFAVKVGILDPTAKGRTWGLALAPVIEVLSSSSVADGDRRVHWALPVTFEGRFRKLRTYGAAGYFSRGAAFLSGAVEVPVGTRMGATLAVSHSRSLEEDPLSDFLGLAESRLDLTGSAFYSLSDTAAVFAGVGRTVSRLDENGSSLTLSAGVSFGFDRRRWLP